MEYRKFNNTYMLRFDLNEEIMQGLLSFCEKEQVLLAEVNAIGAISRGTVGVYDLEKQAYRQEELEGFMEITGLSGNITSLNGKPYIHLHASLADQHHNIHGGHVLSLTVGATCEMFVHVLEGSVTRERDETLGINLWKF